MPQIEFNIYGEILVYSIQLIYPNLYQRIASLLDEEITITNNTTVDDCFIWNTTDEGVYFWEHVSYGRFERAQSMHPHLFEDGATCTAVLTLNDIAF